MKKKLNFMVLGVFLVSVVVIGFSGFAAQSVNEDDEAAFEAAVDADNMAMQTGVISLDVLQNQTKLASSSRMAADFEGVVLHSAEIQSTPQYDAYYSSERASQLEEMHKAVLENIDGTEVTVGGGTLNNHLQSSEDISDTEKMITVSEVSWLETIYHRDSNYTVNLIFNRDVMTYRMMKEKDSWIIVESVSQQKEFAPSDYQGDKGTFDTFQEAVEFAVQLDVEAENPF